MVQVTCISFQQQAQKDSSPAAPGCQFQERKLYSADWGLYHFIQVIKIPAPRHSLWWQKSPQWTCPRPEHFCQWFPGPGSSAAPAHSHGWKRTMDPTLVTVTRNCPPKNKRMTLVFITVILSKCLSGTTQICESSSKYDWHAVQPTLSFNLFLKEAQQLLVTKWENPF